MGFCFGKDKPFLGWNPQVSAWSKREGFSLVELLSVLTIVLIFIGVLLPVGNGIKKNALKLKTQTQFLRYAYALEAYRQHYGFYPTFIKQGQLTPLGGYGKAFFEALSGTKAEGGFSVYNPQGVCFCFFEPGEYNNESIVDAFGNQQIFLLCRSEDQRGQFFQNSFPESVKTFIPKEGLSQSVSLFSLPNATEKFPFVCTWH